MWHDLGCCIPRSAHSGWCMDHRSPVAWLAFMYSVCVLGSPGALVHLVYRLTWGTGALVHMVHLYTLGTLGTGSLGAPVHLGDPWHWFTWCTGSPRHWFTWVLVHLGTGALVHLVHRYTLGHQCTG